MPSGLGRTVKVTPGDLIWEEDIWRRVGLWLRWAELTGPEGLVLLAIAGLPESALPFQLLSGLTPALSGRA